jgi:PTS hybrid protein
VRLSPAPLVEGTLAAVVAAGAGLTLDEVAAEALGALGPKQGMLPASAAQATTEAAPVADDGWLRCEVVVDNPHGLHVRPAARLVAALKPFAAELRLQKGEKEANPRSLSRLAMLDVRQGTGSSCWREGGCRGGAELLPATGAGSLRRLKHSPIRAPSRRGPLLRGVLVSGGSRRDRCRAV